MPTVSLITENQEVTDYEIDSGEVLYEGLESLGLELPHGCLAGSCSACKVAVIEGQENLENASAIEQNTIDSVYETHKHAEGKTIRLACRARVKGDIKIQVFK